MAGIKAANSVDDLESALGRFWLTPRRVQFKITERFAGIIADHFIVYTGLGGGDCGVGFKTGEKWLVEGARDKAGRWIAHQCSVTKPASEAQNILVALRAKSKAK
jgi:hypothetical protein